MRWAEQLMLVGEPDFDDRDHEAMDGAGMLLVPSVSPGPTSSSTSTATAGQT